MTQQQLVQEFETFSKAEKSAVMRQLLKIFEKDLSSEQTENRLTGEPFKIDTFRLYPRRELDFDNIGKLIEEIEGDFHK